MDIWQAMILGIVEGVTEYLPISSTGHLILAQRLMGITDSPQANAYAICIQAGAIVAVFGLYFRRIREMGQGIIGRSPEGLRLAINIMTAFAPAAVIGVLFNDKIEHYLFGLWPVVAAWFVGGVVILVVARYRQRAGTDKRNGGLAIIHLTWRGALVIGLCQCLSMWPGTSRSLVTIVGGVLVGLSLPAAVEFTFLIGAITLGAATGYKALDEGRLMLETYGWLPISVGFLFALISAVVAVKWMVSYLNNNGLAMFGYYRVTLAVIVAAMILSGTITTGG